MESLGIIMTPNERTTGSANSLDQANGMDAAEEASHPNPEGGNQEDSSTGQEEPHMGQEDPQTTESKRFMIRMKANNKRNQINKMKLKLRLLERSSRLGVTQG